MSKYLFGAYDAPRLKAIAIHLERGFTDSDSFEQPEQGGEDNLF